MEALSHLISNIFHRQAPDITCVELRVDGTMSTFQVCGDSDATKEAVAGRLQTSHDQLEELHVGLFVIFCKSNQYTTVNEAASLMFGRPSSIRGPAYVVRQVDSHWTVYQSCELEDIRMHFQVFQRGHKCPTVAVDVKTHAFKEVSETHTETIPVIRVVIAQTLDEYKESKNQLPVERIVIDVAEEEEDDNVSAGVRGLPVRRHQKRPANRRRARDDEEGEGKEPPVRRSQRIREKKK